MQLTKYENRLIHEASPYLLQHAGHPVNWYPWGDDALQRAIDDDKLIFLSIGYSTCHWCHVMSHESFEDEKVADILNKDFVSIKVDREQRPDIDHVYMTYAQALIGTGGWPLNLILMPGGEPFFAATYLPKEDKGEMKGLKTLLLEAVELYKKQKKTVVEFCKKIHKDTQRIQAVGDGGDITRGTAFRNVLDYMMKNYDSDNGGFSKQAPKFPMPHYILTALYASEAFDLPNIRNAAENTLMMIRQGGIYDQIGFGFMRYATDKKWLIPHFEKMLYDNALLIYTYTEAYRLTGRIGYAETAHEIISYLLSEMESEEGGFFAAQDADSENKEGAYYLWTPEEIREVVGQGLERPVAKMLGICEDSESKFAGKWVPNRMECVGKMNEKLWEELRQKMYERRLNRIRPHRDEKILTGWNGLLIAALARSGAILKEDAYIRKAMHILSAIGGDEEPADLKHGYFENNDLGPAFFEDYAYVIWGLIELFKATKMPEFTLQAKALARYCERVFKMEDGGYAMTRHEQNGLVIKPMLLTDQAVPSGNGIHLWNLLRLSNMGEDKILTQAADIHESFMRGVAALQPLGSMSCVIGMLRTGRLQ